MQQSVCVYMYVCIYIYILYIYIYIYTYITSFLLQFMRTITHFCQGTIQNAVWEADHSIRENTFRYGPKGRI